MNKNRVLSVLLLIILLSISFSCDNNDVNEVNYELQSIDKDKVETPTTKS